MAYDPNELLREVSGVGSGLRAMSTSTQAKTFATDAGNLLLPRLTPVKIVAGEWSKWLDADVNTIAGFVWSDEVQTDATDEVLGNVMMAGRIHHDDIPLGGQTQSILDTALNAARDKGFIIEGMTVGFG